MSASDQEFHQKTKTNQQEDCDWFLCCFEVFKVSPVNFHNDERHQNGPSPQDDISTQNKRRESLKQKLTTLFRNKKIKQQQNNRKSTRLRSLRCESSETYTPHEKASIAVFRSHSMSLLRKSIDFEEKYHVPSGPVVFAGMNSMQIKLGSEFASMPETPAILSGGVSVSTPFSQQLMRNNSGGDNHQQPPLNTALRGENRLSSLAKTCKEALFRVRRSGGGGDTASRLAARGMVGSPTEMVCGNNGNNSSDLRSVDSIQTEATLNTSSADSNRSATERAWMSPPSTPRTRGRKDLERLCDISTSYSEVLQLQSISDDAILHCIYVLLAADSCSLASPVASQEDASCVDSTETDDVARTPTPPIAVTVITVPQRRLSSTTQKSRSGSQNTSGSNSISNAEEVLGTLAPDSVNEAVNAMLRTLWTRHSAQRTQKEEDAEEVCQRSSSNESVTSLCITHPSRTKSPILSRPQHYTCIDVDRWLRPTSRETQVVRVAADCLHRLSSLLRGAGHNSLQDARLCAQTCIQLLQTVQMTDTMGCAFDTDVDSHRRLELASAYSLLCCVLDEMGLVGDALVADRKARDLYAAAAGGSGGGVPSERVEKK